MGHAAQPVGRAICWEGAMMAPRDHSLEAVPEPSRQAQVAHKRMTVLARMVEFEIVPRLLLAHRSTPEVRENPVINGPAADISHVARLIQLLMNHDAAGIRSCVEQFMADGPGFETLCLDLLAPTATRLRQLGQEGHCHSTTVMVGLWRLQQLLREWATDFRQMERGEADRRALIAAPPGQPHTFEVLMTTEFFRCAGWTVWSGPVASRGDLVELVRQNWFAVASFWLPSKAELNALALTIRTIRRASRNRALGILVDGNIFGEQPELARLIGADAIAWHGRQAPMQAKHVISLVAARE